MLACLPSREGSSSPTTTLLPWHGPTVGHGFAARKPHELKTVITAALAINGPAMIDAVVAPTELPNLPHLNLDVIGQFALAKIREAVLAIAGGG